MNAFEKALLNDIPADEASSFFLRVTGRDKVASAAELEKMWNELPSEEQQQILKQAQDEGFLEKMMPGTEHYHSDRMRAALEGMAARCWRAKEANMMGAPMGPPPAAAKMPAPTPTALPPTAQGMNSVKMAFLEAAEKMKLAKLVGNMTDKEKRDELKDPKKTPKRSAIVGGIAGALGGGVGGALGTHGQGMKGKHRALVAGAHALVAGAGGASGAYLGGKYRRKKIEESLKKAASAMKIAFGNGEGNPAPPSGGMQEDDEPSLEQYLANEAMGAQAEEQAGASFFQQRLMAAQQELEQTKQQAEQTAQQVEELQQQVAQNDQSVQAAMQQAQMSSQTAMSNVQQAHQMAMDATNQAMESQAEVLRQKQLAAAMRMGVQTLKDNVMGAMAQDPTDELAKQLQAPPPGTAGPVGGQPPPPPAPVDPATGQPMAPVDPATGQPADPAAAGGAPAEAAPTEGGGEKKPEKKESKEKKDSDDGDDKKDSKTHVEVKTGSIEQRFLEAFRRSA